MFFDGRSEILPYMTELWQQVESVIGLTVSVTILWLSGEVAMQADMPRSSTILDVLLKLEAGGAGVNRYTKLLKDGEPLARSVRLGDLKLGAEAVLYVLNCPGRTYIRQMDAEHDDNGIIYKALLLGDSRTGKTCFSNRLLHNTWSSDYKRTIGVDLGAIQLTTEGGRVVRMQLYDTCGEERMRAQTGNARIGPGVILIFFSLVNRSSFEAVPVLVDLAKTEYSSLLMVSIVGTHADAERHEVSYQEAEDLAKKLRCRYFETSSLTGQGVTEAFHQTLDHLLNVTTEMVIQIGG
ncbi:unnamed protein product [Effrenium voratum]|uniref:Uncharacterized protein n=1 Tax=Effrenium voratum TaxID=2562239 RepID=A0AA36MYN8_9DINO|nr:unnamed protein product [Effrenium voratum]